MNLGQVKHLMLEDSLKTESAFLSQSDSEEREGKKGMNDIIESTSSLARASDSNESVERQNIPKPIINDVIMEVHSSSAS